MKMKLLITLFVFMLSKHAVESQEGIWGEFTKDGDIQDALLGIARISPRECPVVLIFDEQMPELSVSHKFMHKMHKHWRMLIIINFSSYKILEYESQYGTTDTTLILQHILHSLYRRCSCYIFIVWLKDPRILYPETSDTAYRLNPGWRQSDKVILVVHHITKRYKSLISLRFWDFIPNVIGVKRGKQELENDEIKIFTVLPFLTNGKRISKELDTWEVVEKKFLGAHQLFIDRFRNLHMANLKLGMFWQEPFFIWGTLEDPYLDGLDWRIFMLCQKNLNFTFTWVLVNETGRLTHQGNKSASWTGMMAMISDGVVNVGLGGLSVTSERLSYFDFSRTYYTDSFVFISPFNYHSKSATETLLQPFHEYVWIAMFVSMLVGMVTLQIVTVLQQEIHKAYIYDKHFEDSKFTNPQVTAGFIITVCCQKSFRYWPKTFPVQCVYYGTSLTIFILGMAFSSCLISVFLSLKTFPIVDKLENIHKTGLPISIKRFGGYLDQYMENSQNQFIAEMYRKAELVDYFSSTKAIDEVILGKRIHVDSKARVLFTGRYRYDSSRGLKFHVSSDAIVQFANLGWPCQKNWPLMTKFNSIISRAVESGLVQFWMDEFVKGKFGGDALAWKIPSGINLSSKLSGIQNHSEAFVTNEGGFVPLSEKHISGVINWLQTGVALSILLFLLECTLGTLFFTTATIKQVVLSLWNNRTLKASPAIIPRGERQNEFPQLVWSDFDNHRSFKKMK